MPAKFLSWCTPCSPHEDPQEPGRPQTLKHRQERHLEVEQRGRRPTDWEPDRVEVPCCKEPFKANLFLLCGVFGSRSRLRRFSFVFRCCRFDRSSFLEISPSQWVLMTVRREMALKRRRERVLWSVKCGKMSFCKRRSSLIVASSGTAASARRRVRETDIPSVLQGRHMQAVSSKNGRSWSASSSSGDGQDQMLAYNAQWTNMTKLRDLREENKRLKGEGKKSAVQFDDPSEEA